MVNQLQIGNNSLLKDNEKEQIICFALLYTYYILCKKVDLTFQIKTTVRIT